MNQRSGDGQYSVTSVFSTQRGCVIRRTGGAAGGGGGQPARANEAKRAAIPNLVESDQ